MGQYWMVVNLDKREFLDPHKLGTGLKLWEQLANHPGTGAALIVLCAAMPEPRGGGDLDLEENWHGPERVDMTKEGPPVPGYPEVASRTIGRWAGDRIALVGDYAERGDIKSLRVTDPPENVIYDLCSDQPDEKNLVHGPPFTDITDDVCAVIEHELNGHYEGKGWRNFTRNEEVKS